MVPGRAAENVIGEFGARAVSEGANLNVMETKSQGEFMFKENSGLNVAGQRRPGLSRSATKRWTCKGHG